MGVLAALPSLVTNVPLNNRPVSAGYIPPVDHHIEVTLQRSGNLHGCKWPPTYPMKNPTSFGNLFHFLFFALLTDAVTALFDYCSAYVYSVIIVYGLLLGVLMSGSRLLQDTVCFFLPTWLSTDATLDHLCFELSCST
jgi:hypothetical protein